MTWCLIARASPWIRLVSVVASGPGYIRRLIDQNLDGLFDVGETLVDGPGHGAHGLCFDDADLYYVGDNGVWKVTDTDDDGTPDSPPIRVLEIKTGGEHDAHALRKGPDNHWYLIAGNGTKGMFASAECRSSGNRKSAGRRDLANQSRLEPTRGLGARFS